MITKKDLKYHDLEDIYQYFDCIIDFKINGQYSQVEKLIKELSRSQKVELCQYLRDLEQSEHNNYVYDKVLSILK